ncbi:MAG TPA: hypothetical protein VJP86_04790 [Vicinamibacterales bacterium]|jgi:hypothetical protein|nr:hypothetical protein [Vicinamibacterales bacterium]
MSAFTIYVLATNDSGTRLALQTAAARIRESSGKVLLIVPAVVSFAEPLESPAFDPSSVARHYRALAAASNVRATVRVCVCRHPQHVFDRLLLKHVDVVIGGRRGRWFKTEEEKLARSLGASGHSVTFATEDHETQVARTALAATG